MSSVVTDIMQGIGCSYSTNPSTTWTLHVRPQADVSFRSRAFTVRLCSSEHRQALVRVFLTHAWLIRRSHTPHGCRAVYRTPRNRFEQLATTAPIQLTLKHKNDLWQSNREAKFDIRGSRLTALTQKSERATYVFYLPSLRRQSELI